MSKRVVITGMGVLSPIGNSTPEYWDGLKSGKNGIDEITLFDTSNYSVHLAGEVSIQLDEYIHSKELNRMDRYTAFAILSAREAIAQAKLNDESIDKNQIGVIIGSGVGGIKTFEEQHQRLLKNPRRVSPFFIPSMIADIASGYVSIEHGFKGPNYSVVSACATGSHSIGDAFRLIKYGDAKAIVCGGAEAGITPISIAGFSNMKALTKNPDANSACRPFDLNRDGFVMGEGAGMLVLEELEHAQQRNAPILAEIIGYGATADAHHLTTPAPNGEGAVRAMKRAIEDADISPTNVDYVNAHGTSTHYNDKNESIAIRTVFGEHAENLYVSSTKSMTGHLLGAAGGIEAIAGILAIQNSIVPPTINYTTEDEDCNLHYTPNNAVEKSVDYVMSNTFGFGGHNAVLLFKKFTS
jgi:3-oxoacyl-[acyl-carrier-protein] synthase II